MRVVTSLVCALVITTAVGCGDKGSGDDNGTAGSASQAGSSNTAGSASQAGSSSTAGTSSAGTSSAGTSSGGSSGGSASAAMPVYTFDADVQGFKVQPTSAAVGVDPVLQTDVMIGFNAADGSPDPGSLQLDIPYSAASQYVSAGVNIATAVDLTGKKVKALVKIVSGYGSADDLLLAPGNAKLYIKTGMAYVYASAAVANLTSIGTWTAIEFDPEFPGYQAVGAYDPTQVLEIGVQFDTNSASTTAAPAVVLVDSISY
jgi:hypothetical protein